MGFVTEVFRRTPGVVRSIHPTHSVSALGPLARHLTEAHHRAPSVFGTGSPWQRFADTLPVVDEYAMGLPELGVALVAQGVADLACSWIRNCLGLGVGVSELAHMMWWSFRVDVLLAPLGVAAAIAFPSGPMAVVVATTPLLLLAMLAGDRRRHIDGMLELSSAFHDAADRARRDQLTGLGNRLAWDEAVSRVERRTGPIGVIMLDVDWLKVVNDDYGHEAGDRLLRVVAGVLDAVVPDDATVCRLGGDEFGVLLVDSDLVEADRVAAFIRAGLAACAPVYDTVVSASIGTAASHGPGSVQAALYDADRDIYRHKAARGRSRSRPRSI